MEEPLILLIFATSVSLVTILTCLTVVPTLYNEINEFHYATILEINEFRVMAEETWQNITFINNELNRSRAKRSHHFQQPQDSEPDISQVQYIYYTPNRQEYVSQQPNLNDGQRDEALAQLAYRHHAAQETAQITAWNQVTEHFSAGLVPGDLLVATRVTGVASPAASASTTRNVRVPYRLPGLGAPLPPHLGGRLPGLGAPMEPATTILLNGGPVRVPIEDGPQRFPLRRPFVQSGPAIPGPNGEPLVPIKVPVVVGPGEEDCYEEELICPPGPPGLPGKDGQPGSPGQEGFLGQPGHVPVSPPCSFAPRSCQNCPPGPPGNEGKTGPNGLPGKPGAAGYPGYGGGNGRPGLMGPRGKRGKPGTDGKTGPIGAPGRDSSHGKGLTGLKGPPGREGKKGARGATGESFDTKFGKRGYPGLPGKEGKPGPRGPRGLPGAAGAEGPTGPDAQYCPCPRRSQNILYLDNE